MATISSRTDFKDYCSNNKYYKWYFNLIVKAEKRNWDRKSSPVYVEKHHIVPKSIIKNDETVYLTAREHFICHMLLPKFLKGIHKRKMMLALHRLVFGNKHLKINYVKNSKIYELIKIRCSTFLSDRTKEYWSNIDSDTRSCMRSGEKNSMFGKKHKQYSKDLVSIKAKERLKDKNNHPLYNIGHSKETKLKMSINAPAKNYTFLHNNEKIEIYNLRKFCRENNLDQGAMTRVNSGKQIQHKGYYKECPQ